MSGLKIKVMFMISLLIAFTVILTSCSFIEGLFGKEDEVVEPPASDIDFEKEYTIQYSDNNGIHTIKVKYGDLYSLDVIPYKEGYIFKGLFNAEVGGVQYVNAQGMALSAFTDQSNVVLFPQFEAKKYTIILDYGDAEANDIREIEVAYNDKITYLPSNLYLKGKKFVGWFTQDNKEGEQIGDEHGVLPGKNVVSTDNFQIDDSTKNIYLYAGFDTQIYTLNLYFGEGYNPEIVKVEHGTSINDIEVQTRVNGMGVYSWSLVENDINKEYIFKGNIEEDGIILFAAELAPVLDFKTQSGEIVASIIAKEGEEISFPRIKEDGKLCFNWENSEHEIVDYKIMPAQSETFYAVWSKSITFKRYTSKLITDSGLKYQYGDVLDLKEEFGLSLYYLQNNGYKNLRFSIRLLVREEHDGYQHWYLSNSEDGSNTIKHVEFEHGSGYREYSSKWYDFEFITNIEWCKDIMYLKYSASGGLDDNWYCEAMEVTVTVY